jgi:predicted metal-dependent peptidase
MNKTLIVVILDESGSMAHTKLEVIDGFNTFIETQKLVNDDIARLTLVKFNTCVTTVYSGINSNDRKFIQKFLILFLKLFFRARSADSARNDT